MISNRIKHWSRLFQLALFLSTNIAFAQSYTPGVPVLDSTNYVEYIPGNLPVVISSPHGGYLEPATIPDRNCNGCVYVRDAYTQELTRKIFAQFHDTTGCYPHVVINLLHRKKFDANRDLGDAADGDSTVEKAWRAYHRFLDSAKNQVTKDYGAGLFLDMHGHGHSIQRLELGYTLSRSDLQQPDSILNLHSSSLNSLVSSNLQSQNLSELLRGNQAFGTSLENSGIRAVPSLQDPFPAGNEPYFTGGYNTVRHGSKNGGTIDGIQIECNQAVRFDAARRERLADSIVLAVIDFVDAHYFPKFDSLYCGLISLSENEIPLNDIQIFPNPANGYLNIQSHLGKLEISIFNSIGENLGELTWTGSPLDIGFLGNGCYYLVIQEDGEPILAPRKLIIQH